MADSGNFNDDFPNDENFVWHDYLETSNAVEVPHELFAHVEQSVQSSFPQGMMLEVPDKLKPNKYWPAVIKMSCGPLLSMCYLGPPNVRMPEFWCDLGHRVDVKPVGWCVAQIAEDPSTSVGLEPPDSMLQQFPHQDWQQILNDTTERNKNSVSTQLLEAGMCTVFENIKEGMKIEVQDEKNPLKHWVATVIENNGGRLLLRYDSPDPTLKDFWLFYTSPRLFSFGWAENKGSPWQYCPPDNSKVPLSEDECQSILHTARLETELLLKNIPDDLFQNLVPETSHKFAVGMKLETVHPSSRAEVCPATVVDTFETGHILLQLDAVSRGEEDEPPLCWVCSADDPYLLPAGWSKQHDVRVTAPQGWTSDKGEFDWEEYLLHTKSTAAPSSCFLKYESAADLGFVQGHKLEAASPNDSHEICVASIDKTLGHLVWIRLDSEDSESPTHIVSTNSLEIFPVGWCGSNSYPLKPPRNYKEICRKTIPIPLAPAASEVTQKSSWCPVIYFNHKCFTGPFLSKGKLAQLPKAVGPGPVTLVMREVLSMLISVAYKSRQVLKELQTDGPLGPDMTIEVLKAKLKSAVYRANVGIITSAVKVPDYCKEVCLKLQSCPHLFGPECFADNCPVGCSVLSKSRFTNYWSKGKRTQNASDLIDVKPKKRGRKSKNALLLQQDDLEDETKKDEDEDQESGEEGDSLSRPDSATDENKTKQKLYPQFEMRTRGAKLPNFALQLSNWSWGKDEYIPNKRSKRVYSSDTNKSSLERADTRPAMKRRGRPNKVAIHPLKRNFPATLNQNPMLWSVEDVSHYLLHTPDCGTLAPRLAKEDIDGHAFLLLNLPTIQENLQLQLGIAIKLCQHVERVKYAYISRLNGLY